ncbi:hypothetical protein O4H52_14660 [Sphingomonadaceae bacterium G21617-S1]|nr:hypothetical protein [Sphingomonadaceae bacterium G21617-S1]
MNDVPYLLRGIERLTTDSSTLISSSKYLNHPRMREWIANIILKKNGPDVPPQSEMFPVYEMLAEIRDADHVEELFSRERAVNPALDAWLSESYMSDYDVDYFKKFEPGSLGYTFYKDVIEKNYEIIIYKKPRPKTQMDYFIFRAGQNHDIEHILTGGDFSYMGEIVPAWARIANQFKHLSPELAGEVSVIYMLVVLRYTIRTLLHYPKIWPVAQDAIERGMLVGKSSDPYFLAKYEDLFPLPLEEARERAGVRNARFVDCSEISEVWAGRKPETA